MKNPQEVLKMATTKTSGDADEVELDEEFLSEALLADKIIKLQLACLLPLKDDLADWLNKIMNMSDITKENFMDKLDNGVIICHLAKIISNWCYNHHYGHHHLDHLESSKWSNEPMTSMSLNYGNNQFLYNLIRMEQLKIWEDAKCRTFYARDNVSNFIRWSKEFGVNQSVLFESDDLVLHANTRQVVLCLLDVARIACVKHGFTEAPGLVKFEQEIDRELAAELLNNHSKLDHNNAVAAAADGKLAQIRNLETGCDNDNILRKGANQNIIECKNRNLSSLGKNSRYRGSTADATDDLIMRYCMHKEEEAVKKKAAEAAAAAAALEAARMDEITVPSDATRTGDARQEKLEGSGRNVDVGKENEAVAMMSIVAGRSGDGSGIMAANEQNDARINLDNNNIDDAENVSPLTATSSTGGVAATTCDNKPALLLSQSDSITVDSSDLEGRPNSASKSSSNDPSAIHGNRHNLTYDNRIDSLDSGEGRTESASTSHSRTPINNSANLPNQTRSINNDSFQSSIPRPIRKSNSSSSLMSNSSSIGSTSELSSSRSSLLSERNETAGSGKRNISSDLDGKVMRIAKSYYGKGATKGVTRLSEGKYKIADRIVFVRLLKGHRVMVRIGGGWDTLENFLFRHKSDPSQVIDVDNLLPIETKMSFDKNRPHNSSQTMMSNVTNTPSTPSSASKYSRLPYYRRSSSASSTNLSISTNISTISNHSPTIDNYVLVNCATPPGAIQSIQQRSMNDLTIGNGNNVRTNQQLTGSTNKQNIPYLLIHRGQNNQIKRQLPNFHNQHNSKSPSSIGGVGNQHKLLLTNISKEHQQQPIKMTSSSTTNLYPATLTTSRIFTPANNVKSTKQQHQQQAKSINKSTNNLHTTNGNIGQKQETIRKLGRSNDSLQTSYLYKSPLSHSKQNQQHLIQSNGTPMKRRIDSYRKLNNSRAK